MPCCGAKFCRSLQLAWRNKAQGYSQLLTQRCVAVIRLCDLKTRFQDAELGVTAAAYAGCRLAALTPAMRGNMLETVARGFSQQLEPNSTILNPSPGERCDGRRRGISQAEYDWLHDGRRVQCKSAQLY